MFHKSVPFRYRVAQLHMSHSIVKIYLTLKTSLFKSRSQSTCNSWMQAVSFTSPEFLVSVEWAPQYSHLKLITKISVKNGTLILQDLISPTKPQEWQGTSKIIGSWSVKFSSSKGLAKLIFLPILLASTYFISNYAFYLLYPISTSSSKVLILCEICRFLSILGAKGFLMLELPVGSDILTVKGNFSPSR